SRTRSNRCGRVTAKTAWFGGKAAFTSSTRRRSGTRLARAEGPLPPGRALTSGRLDPIFARMRKPLAHPLMKAAASACLLAAIVVSPATTFGQTTEDPLPSPTLPFEPETEGDESEASSDPT